MVLTKTTCHNQGLDCPAFTKIWKHYSTCVIFTIERLRIYILALWISYLYHFASYLFFFHTNPANAPQSIFPPIRDAGNFLHQWAFQVPKGAVPYKAISCGDQAPNGCLPCHSEAGPRGHKAVHARKLLVAQRSVAAVALDPWKATGWCWHAATGKPGPLSL